MKNSTNSSLDLSKYRFIPPSKVLKTQNQPENSISQPVKEHKKNDKQNKSSLSRSISNPKFNKPKIKTDEHINKLTQHIAELRNKEVQYINEIYQLKQSNEELKAKYEEVYKALINKNRQVQETNNKLKYYEAQSKQKCQEHTLIIDSLKKVIDSQIIKISQLQEKMVNLDTNRSIESTPRYSANTPDFLMNTPEDHKQRKNNFGTQFPSSLKKQLSRIDESVEELQTSRIEGEMKTQHSLLMEEIDEYLSKWHKKKN